MTRYICLRDDDTNYFTTFDELKAGYGDIWDNLPITLATIPFVHGSEKKILDYDTTSSKFRKLREWEVQASERELAEYHKVYPLGDNQTLINELRKMQEKGTIEIAQHGVTHRYNERGAEMFSDSVSYYAIREGKEYLEKCFSHQISTFIPPSNTIDLGCAKAADALGLNLFTSGTIRCRSKLDKIKTCIKDPSPVVERLNKDRKNLPIRRRANIRFITSYTYGLAAELDSMFEKMKLDLDSYGFAAVGTHYRLLSDKKYQDNYLQLIDRLYCLPNVKFVTARDYFKLVEKRYYE